MLTISRREATGLGEPGSIGGKELKSFLHVIRRLVRQAGAVGAVLVNGTKAVPSRYLYPPAAAASDGGKGGGGKTKTKHKTMYRFDFLRKLIHERKQKQKEQQQKQSGNLTTADTSTAPRLVTTKRNPLPEVEFYIGTLEFSLGFRVLNLSTDTSNAAAIKRTVLTTGGSSGSGGDGVLERGGWNIVGALWPPEYILETVVQSQQFTPAGADFGRGDTDSGRQDGLIVMSSVNCGFIDFAVNFLLSMRQPTVNIKVNIKNRF